MALTYIPFVAMLLPYSAQPLLFAKLVCITRLLHQPASTMQCRLIWGEYIVCAALPLPTHRAGFSTTQM
jgi:hypothetical protein